MSSSIVDAVRKRPGMYVGGQGTAGVHHLVWEVLANSLDQHLAGNAGAITVTLHGDGAITVEDDGEGFPVHTVDGVALPEIALTTWHDTGTLDGHRPHEAIDAVQTIVGLALQTHVGTSRNWRALGKRLARPAK